MRLFIINLLFIICPLIQATPVEANKSIDIQDVYLEMDSTDAEVLFLKEPYDDSKFTVRIRKGQEWLEGSIEVKGSFTRNFIKKSFLIKLKKDQQWQGFRKLSFNAMVTDPSSMREWLAWDLIEKLGMASPQVKYSRVFINNEFIGLFLFLEWIEPSMFESFGLGKDGEFYHPIDSKFCGDLTLNNLSRLSECWYKLAPRNKDFSKLQKLVEDISATDVDEFDQFLENNFDIDSLINWLLVNTIVSSSDTYNKNYFLYFSQKSKKWVVVPWDYDLSFGRGNDSGYAFPKSILNDNFQYYYSPELGNPNPLKEKTLSNPKMLDRFRTHLRHVLGLRKGPLPEGVFGSFSPSKFREKITQLDKTIRNDLLLDKYKPIRANELNKHVEALVFYNLARYNFLKNQVLTPSVFKTPRWIPYSAYKKLDAEELSKSTVPNEPVNVSPFPEDRTYLPLVLSSTVSIRPGQKQVVPTDEYLARPLGVINIDTLSKTARIRLEVEMDHRPSALPPSINDPEKCIQRNWYLDLKTLNTELKVSLVLDYLQENSSHNELGSLINEDNEVSLRLWLSQKGEWFQLTTNNNTLINTFATKSLTVKPGIVLYFVACLSNDVKD